MATASVTNTLVNGTTPDASIWNTNYSDLVTFLNSNVLHLDGSKAMTGALAMGSNKITGMAAGTAATDGVRYDQISGLASSSHNHDGSYASAEHGHSYGGPYATGGVYHDETLPSLTNTMSSIAATSFARPAGWSTTLVIAWAAIAYGAVPTSGNQINARIDIDSNAGNTIQSPSADTNHPIVQAFPSNSHTTSDSTINLAVAASLSSTTGGTGKYCTINWIAIRAS